MTTIFVGGSNNIDYITPDHVTLALRQIGIKESDVTTVVCGLEKGPEVAGMTWAQDKHKMLDVHTPHLEKYGQIAWVIRNKVVISHASIMIIYWDGKSAGARNLMNQARKRGVTVYKIQCEKGRVDVPREWDRVISEEEWGWTSEW